MDKGKFIKYGEGGMKMLGGGGGLKFWVCKLGEL